MKINAVINSQMVREEIPENIKLSDNESLSVKETTVIIAEFDRNATPFISAEFEKGFSVGVKALVERIKFADNSAKVTMEYIGEFVYLPEYVSIKDIMNAINDLIRKVFNPNA